ncbi:GNAT family N-acetyltransferase [Sphingobium lignivorans]|uniref:L-amino acid N-acyltransferase YncA n=1 Tax=Sphingobium lignivorans TaxID=2735886 RepID=A0ABR6NES1_9SPHN|nr:GNAT family N-acetyltransferase [Sphingobium lignivorans]MBB5985566.1 L-amino acid N-acyltransferase YncA [Sphingobium lignivorans]
MMNEAISNSGGEEELVMESGSIVTDAPVIRAATPEDWPGIWSVIEPVIREGETYPLDRDLDESAARAYWFAADKSVFVALGPTGEVIGTYTLRPNSTGPAAHVANAGYAVRPDQRGKGVAQALCRHSLETARRQGYRAMQYNLVIATNHRAVRLWQHMGFTIIGALPGAFRHPKLGYVDAYIMYQEFTGPS